MRVALLASANSIHTVQWAKYLFLAGIDVSVISQHTKNVDMPTYIPVYTLPYKGRWGYFTNASAVKKILAEMKPDILHAHYASGYGTTAGLVNFHPYILSVWGSDVYDFPYKSFMHNWILRKNLYAADKLTSTSHCMVQQTLNITSKLQVFPVVPFGVDLTKFIPQKYNFNNFNYDDIVIGTVKTMSEKYGIDTLIKAFSILKNNLLRTHPDVANKLKLCLVGGGSQLDELKKLSEDMGISDVVQFIGQVSHDEVPIYLKKLDIYVALSRWESFGVAIIEAGAMKKPVIVSNVGGLSEVVQHKKTGLIVEKENPEMAAQALKDLVLSPQTRDLYGANAYQFVRQNFSWQICVDKMIKVYQQVLSDKN